MEIKVLGCSTSWSELPNSSYCINGKILIDCGGATNKRLEANGIKMEDIEHIFITHFHSDHFFGIIEYLNFAIHYAKERKKLTIYGPLGLIERINVILKYFIMPRKEVDVFEFVNLIEIKDENVEFFIDSIKIKPYRLNHNNVFDYGYILQSETKTVGFSGDCILDESLEKFVSRCDVAFVDCCSRVSSQNHNGVDGYHKLKDKYPKCDLIAVHCTSDVYANSEELNVKKAKPNTIYLI